ncbi:MAG: PEP-CTERM sorting domain-containing protein [Planctomycetota bacterium]
MTRLFTTTTLIAAITLIGSADAASIVPTDTGSINSGTVTGTLSVIDPPTTSESALGVALGQGFNTVSGSTGFDDGRGRGGFEADGTAFTNSDTTTKFLSNGVVTFNFDVADGTVINAVYAKWQSQGNQSSNVVYSFSEATSGSTSRDHKAGSAPGDLVLGWTDSGSTARSTNLGLIFTGPITVSGGDGFTLTIDSTVSGDTAFSDGNNSRVASFDAVAIDFTPIPEPGSLALLGLGGLLIGARRRRG